MHLLRTKFDNGIVAEFLPPRRESNKIVILCDGLPTLPAKKKLIQFLSRKNFWVFHIRYAGTWESDGAFLSHEPHEDIISLLGYLPNGFKDIWTGEQFRTDYERVFVIGSSFGGTTALMASLDKRIDKVIALCPPVDWTHQEETEPLSELKRILEEGYGGGYRFSDDDWGKLESGTFFNPINHIKNFDPKKIMIIHAQDDDVVSYGPVSDFAHNIKCSFISRKKGGHLSSSLLMEWLIWRQVKNFLA